MQAQTNSSSEAEAITPANLKRTIDRIRPAMASKRLDLPSICDICGFARSTRRHQSCSKLRQQRKTEEWAALMAEKAAARATREKRYAR